MINRVVNLGINKGKNNDKSSYQITRLHNSLPMSIVDTPEKDLSYVDKKFDMIRVYKPSLKSSSSFFLVQFVQCII